MFTFDYGAASTTEQQIVFDAVTFASTFYQQAIGRTVTQATTITLSSTAQGCAGAGSSAFSGIRFTTICYANTGWTTHGTVNKTKILIHEVFHLIQFEMRWLGNPSGNVGAHWMNEGSAEYFGWLGVANRGSLSMETARGCMVKEVADFAQQQPPGLPNLDQLETPSSFNRPGNAYAIAMLGADQMATRTSASAILTYGSSIAANASHASAFQSAFGMSLSAFYDQFPGYKNSLPVPASYACRI